MTAAIDFKILPFLLTRTTTTTTTTNQKTIQIFSRFGSKIFYFSKKRKKNNKKLKLQAVNDISLIQ